MIANNSKIGILGRGSWGNTLAFLLGQQSQVILWDRDEARVRRTNTTRRFKKPLFQKYPDSIYITADLNELKDCQIIINAISVKGIANVFQKIQNIGLSKKTIIVNGSKGVEPLSLQRPTEIIKEFLPENPMAVISGPNLAKEMIKGKPMVTEVAATDEKTAEQIKDLISGPTLRVYTCTDLVGVELCGAFKNIIAIAAGILDGLDQGESAKASLLTRGLHEMSQFVTLMGGKAETVMGPAGIGDLIATCSCDLSRNHRVGNMLARGKNLNQIIETLGEVAEGINTTYAVFRICQDKNLQLPIVEQMKDILDNNITPVEAVLNLMKRGSSTETI